MEALRQVKDPEVGYDIVELGLVYAVETASDGGVFVNYTLTHPGCPMADHFEREIRKATEAVPSVVYVRLNLIFEPRWEPKMASPAIQKALRLL